MSNTWRTKGTPTNGKILNARLEPENEYDKYAVACSWKTYGVVVGHLSKGKTGCCRVEVTGKRMNIGDGEGLQIPVYFTFLEKQNLLINWKIFYHH